MYGTVPFVRQGSCFHPVPKPYYTLTAVFFPLQRVVFPVASEREAMHPPVWKAAEVCGRRHQGRLEQFLVGPALLLAGSCPSSGGESLMVPATFRPGSKHGEKEAPRFRSLPHMF